MNRELLRRRIWIAVLCYLMSFQSSDAQGVTVTGQIELIKGAAVKAPGDLSNVALWLSPPAESAVRPISHSDRPPLRMAQKHKSFDPHVLVTQVGSIIEFPNHDPFFHNVFSLFEGKRFDLGLYEAGSSRTVHFDRPGICYIFCNIHPEMSAVIVVVDTSYFGISNQSGHIAIPGVPAGRYLLQAWAERALPEDLKSLTREVVVSERTLSLGTIRIPETESISVVHKNKYGRDYDPPARSIYDKP